MPIIYKYESMALSEAYWSDLSKRITKPTETRNKRPDISAKEVEFLKQYLDPSDEVLDIGSGTGLIVNRIQPLVKSIIAVETFEGLSNFITDKENVTVINAKIEGFLIRKTFDKILATGVMYYFTYEEARSIYLNIYRMLKPGGLFLMRNHCGLKETVEIHHSDEVGPYFAQYRQVDNEKKLLEEIGFGEVIVNGNTPEEMNIYDNTRHFYFICKK